MASKKNVKNEYEINIEQIQDEIKNNIREDLYDEITNKIDVESKKSLERMEKRIIRYKNSSIRKRNFIILVLFLIVSIETYIILESRYSIKIDNNKQVIDSSKEEVKDVEDLAEEYDYNIDKYSYLMDNIKTNLIEDKYYLYKDNYTVESIDNKVKLNMAYQLLEEDKISISDSIIKIKVKDLENAYKKIFGNLDNYENENFYSGCIQFIYNEEVNIYMAIDTNCEVDNNKLLEKIKDITKEDENIVIETIVGIYNEKENTLLNIDLEEISDNFDNNLSKYENKLDKRIYIFKKSNGEYYLKEIKEA